MRDHSHSSDYELVLALDGELPARRRYTVDVHLRECAVCERRRASLDETARLATLSSRGGASGARPG